MAQLIALPDQRAPGTTAPNNWWVHNGSVDWTQKTHGFVKTITAHGSSVSSTLDPGQSGNIYTSSDGWKVRASSSKSQTWYSMHYFGATAGVNLNSLGDNQNINSGNKSCWLRDVTGFVCQINGAPTLNGDFGSSSDAANDTCGRTKNVSVYGVYSTTGKKTKIMKFTDRGFKLASVYPAWNSVVSGEWKNFGYGLSSSDASYVINNKLMLMGWVVRVAHEKHCGNKTKNMTFRLRYMIPLVNSGGNSFSLQETGYDWLLAMPPDTPLSQAVNGHAGTAGSAGPTLFVK